VPGRGRPAGCGHRALAATDAELKVPCGARELDDEAASMLLVTSDAQGELTALEWGESGSP